MEIIQNSDRDDHQQGQPDARETLYNDGAIGSIETVQVSTERVVQLRGVLLDLDPGIYRAGGLLPAVPTEPHEFYAAVVKPWLERHPLLNRGEVRSSGTGLHLILWFDRPVVFRSDADRDRWAGTIKIIQAVVPSDPDAPAITAVTRPVGSINSKNGAVVGLLKKGEAVTPEDVLSLSDAMCERPFSTVMQILIGTDRSKPCPICGVDGTELAALDRVGCCYGSCGKVRLQQLYDLVFAPRGTDGKEADGDEQVS